ncbi:unnamed protein product [Ilex paraguariensis]|uniref:Uncharacterized protein n=1 Tax=Ilex paraguariensis TaxID=185542 RepID=A0ABC8REE1_9AQUA
MSNLFKYVLVAGKKLRSALVTRKQDLPTTLCSWPSSFLTLALLGFSNCVPGFSETKPFTDSVFFAVVVSHPNPFR